MYWLMITSRPSLHPFMQVSESGVSDYHMENYTMQQTLSLNQKCWENDDEENCMFLSCHVRVPEWIHTL